MGLRSAPVGLVLVVVAALVTAIDGTGEPPRDAEQQARITVGPNVHVSKPRPNTVHGEVVIAADPSNPARLLAGSMSEELGDDSPSSVVGYASADGGKTWKLTLEMKLAKGRRNTGYYDPAIAFGPDGAVHFAAIRVLPRSVLDLEIVSSGDGGKTWGAPITKTGQLADRPFLAVDCTSGKFRGRIYCTYKALFGSAGDWKPAVSTSRDGGKTLDPPKELDLQQKGPALNPGQGVVLSDGTLVLPYTERIASGKEWKFFGIWLRRTTTGGESFLEEQLLFKRDFLGANANASYIPVLAADPGSKAFADRLYLVWAEKTPAGLQAMLTLSEDKGVTWSKPVRISEQPEPKEGEGKSYHALLPSVAVNGAGIVGVSWYDTRDSREGKPVCNVRFRASLDGGATWLPSVRVTEVASDFELNDRNGGVDPKNWLGDTAGLAADAAGGFHPLWIDNRTGVKQVFTARVTVGTDPPKP